MLIETYKVVSFCLYFVIAICLAMVFVVSFMNSVEKDREPRQRFLDLITGAMVFYIFWIVMNMWRY